MRIRPGVAALVVVLSVSACGGGASPADVVAGAVAKTEEKGSARVEMSIDLEVGGQSAQFTSEGAFDFRRQRGELTMDLSDVEPSAGKVRMIVDRHVVYQQPPPGSEGAKSLPPGKTWLKLDQKKIAQRLGMDAGQFDQLQNGDPSQQLDFLRATGADPEEVGTEEIRGTETTHYRARVDMREAMEARIERFGQAGAKERRDALRRVMEMMEQETVPMDVWIDDDGLPRRMQVAMSMRVPTQGGQTQPLEMRLRMDFFDFGVEVDAEPPPASEVVDVAESLPRGGGSG